MGSYRESVSAAIEDRNLTITSPTRASSENT